MCQESAVTHGPIKSLMADATTGGTKTVSCGNSCKKARRPPIGMHNSQLVGISKLAEAPWEGVGEGQPEAAYRKTYVAGIHGWARMAYPLGCLSRLVSNQHCQRWQSSSRLSFDAQQVLRRCCHRLSSPCSELVLPPVSTLLTILWQGAQILT